MFYYINGTLAHIGDTFAVVDCGGVGYKIHTSVNNLLHYATLNETVKFYTYVHIREDIMDIYGFITQEELSLFEMLISVSGVGPKAALSILSSQSAGDFARAVVLGDAKAITKAPGVGLKLAQRLILELKDKLKKVQESITQTSGESPLSSVQDEAVSALMVLGYSINDANAAVSKAAASDNLEDIIKDALKVLMK